MAGALAPHAGPQRSGAQSGRGHAGVETRTPHQSRTAPDPESPGPACKGPSPVSARAICPCLITAAGRLRMLMSNGAGRRGGGRWTGRRRVICGPGSLSCARAHLSC